MLTQERIFRLKETIRRRQRDITVILENVHDPHNIGAILRSCEAIGIAEAYILYTKETTNKDWYIGRNAARGVTKWLETFFYTDLDICFDTVRGKYKNIYTTHLREDAFSVYELDMTASCALVFGNEHDGVSEEAVNKSDGNVIVPIMGFVESLNVSVAASIILFESMRQRKVKGLYDKPFDATNPMQYSEFKEFVMLSKPRIYRQRPELLEADVSKIIKESI